MEAGAAARNADVSDDGPNHSIADDIDVDGA